MDTVYPLSSMNNTLSCGKAPSGDSQFLTSWINSWDSAGYTGAAHATTLQREQMMGNRMPLHNPTRVSKEPPQDDVPAVPVNTTSILQALWEQLDDKTFESVS